MIVCEEGSSSVTVHADTVTCSCGTRQIRNSDERRETDTGRIVNISVWTVGHAPEMLHSTPKKTDTVSVLKQESCGLDYIRGIHINKRDSVEEDAKSLRYFLTALSCIIRTHTPCTYYT